ncbi:MAG: GWxTD domain-containing protein [Gemmatimonadales bacterium]|nr:GWxTD domain-containing protein [Gemmatimonadales bacterium]
MPRLFDATTVYRSMGFFVGGARLPFVASIRYLAGPAPDSTLTLFSLSLTNQALSFQRRGNEFVADYRVEATFRTDSTSPPVRQISRDERVRVRSFQETLRSDESIIFQQFVTVPPGVYHVQVVVRDRNGPSFSRADGADTVPRFAGQGTTRPIPIYTGQGRKEASALPELLANPRSTLPYGADTVYFYLEAYGPRALAPLVARAVDLSDRELWRDTITLAGTPPFAAGTIAVTPSSLPVGQAAFEATPLGGGDTIRAPFLVSFSNQWVITNFDEMINLLRYFERQDWVDSLRRSPADNRAELWRQFWRATDPVTITPENEALDDYFRRVQQANLRFQSEGEAGWLTDRGEVFITLGEPDEVLDMSSGMDRSGVRAIRWSYTDHRLALYFQDPTGFGQFRLTPSSRAEYQRVLARVRRSR